MPTNADIRSVRQAVLARYPRAVIQVAPSADDPSWLTIRVNGRVFVVDLQPRWGICIDELHGDELAFDTAYAHVEQTAEGAISRVLQLIDSSGGTSTTSRLPVAPPQ